MSSLLVRPSRFGFVLGLAGAALAPRRARAAGPTPVALGVNGSVTEAPFDLAQQLGYFAAEGLDVRFTPFKSAADMVVPLGAGQLDAGGGAAAAGLYNAVARGIDVRAVASLGSDPPGYGFVQLIVRSTLVKAGTFKSVRDLRGLTIGVAGQGGAAFAALDRLLRKNGLSLSDVTIRYLGYPDQVVALQNGSIDASLMPDPGAAEAIGQGIAVRITDDAAFYPNQQIAVLLYGANFLRDRPTGARFMRAYLRGVHEYNGALAGGKLAGPNAAEVIKVLTAGIHLSDPGILKTMTPDGVASDGRLNLASMRDDLEFFRQQGLIPKPVTVEQVVDESFLGQPR